MEIRYTSDIGGVVLSRKTANGSYAQKDTVILEYKEGDSDEVHKVKADIEGVVEFDNTIKKNSTLSKGVLLAKIVDCTHAIVIKDLCATCGRDLREKDGRAGQRKETSEANVSMIHHVPELIVSSKLAQEIGSQDQQNLLATRKLVLLVDLDQTVIHTTNGSVAASQLTPDTFRYNIYRGEYHTKLRPYTREFLQNMSKLYEMHIVTYGQRQYAHMIAKLLDPDGIFFRERVLSREELLSSCHKTRNLKALFPNGDQMIAIIDDRPDVWQYSEALVQVKPYRFFNEVGDINSPVGSKDDAGRFSDEACSPENDNILEKIEHVLTEVHTCFYSHYDKTGEIKDVKAIIEWLRQQVLRRLVIVLSGVVPLGLDLERSDIYRLCIRFGAKVEKTVTDQTTHVIAARWGTDKVHQAARKGISIVTPQWLFTSVENWIKADESEFELTGDSAGTSSGDKSSSNKLIVPELVSMDTMRKDVILDMEHEVDEALSDEGEDDDDNDEEDSKNEEDKDDDDNPEEDTAGPSTSAAAKRKISSSDDTLEFSKRSLMVNEENFGANEDDENLGDNFLGGGSGAPSDDEEDIDNPELPDEDDEDSNPLAKREESTYDEDTMDSYPPGDDDDDEEYDDMAALIERQISEG